MKKITALFVLMVLTTTLFSQTWESNIEQAKSRADKEGKNIILTFSGSDWCIPCMKLEKNIWESQEFVEYSKEHFVLIRADFPKKKGNALSKEQQERNDKLAEIYNQQGLFPLVLVLDKNGKIRGSTGYKNITPKDFIALLHSFESN